MQLFTSFPLSKWESPPISGSMCSPTLFPLFRLHQEISKWTCTYVVHVNLLRKFRNFPVSATSHQPKSVGGACTPFGMRGSMILCQDACTRTLPWVIFPFFLPILEVPASSCLSSAPEYGCPIMSSTSPSYCCVDHVSGCGLGAVSSIFPLASPFVLWATSKYCQVRFI
jgi:hypothetical protein